MAYASIAVREYGAGRILIHTDRLSAVQTGHSQNPVEFWRKVFEWAGQRLSSENIKVGLIVNNPNESADRIHSINPIEVKKFSFSALATKDISEFDLLYIVGLSDTVSSLITQKIADYINAGGGLILESPDIGGQNINVLTGIENVYLYSSERPLQSNAYWTNDGINHYIYYQNVMMGFMVTLRTADLSNYWTVLMSDVENITTTTTTTATVLYDFAKSSASEFAVSFVSSMQKGIVTIES